MIDDEQAASCKLQAGILEVIHSGDEGVAGAEEEEDEDANAAFL